jgi:tRNA 2-thiocytidine biosynthesis protein TtcA
MGRWYSEPHFRSAQGQKKNTSMVRTLSFAQRVCVGKTGKLMQQCRMVDSGARIGVAVSGGMDSGVLLQVLALRKRILPFPVELIALHVNPGFAPGNHAPLLDWVAGLGVAAHMEDTTHGPRAHSPENRKNSPCYYCSMLRRTRLFELCQEYELTHLAFGHNAEDLATTFFMNIMQAGRVEGLSPAQDFFDGKLKVIRPLLMVDKRSILPAARRWGLPILENPCPAAGKSCRTDVWEWVKGFVGQDRRRRNNLFGALERWQLDEDCASKYKRKN